MPTKRIKNRRNIWKHSVADKSKEEEKTIEEDRTHLKSYKIIFYDGKSFYLQTEKLTPEINKEFYDTRPISEDNIAKYTTKIIDIKSLINRLNAEQVLDKFYEYAGISVSVSESAMKVDDDSFKNSNILSSHMNSNNLSVNTLLQRRKHAKLSKIQIQFLRSQINWSKLSLSTLSKKFWVSASNLGRIKRLHTDTILKGPIHPPLRIFGPEKDEIIRLIDEFNSKSETPYITNDVKQHICKTTCREYPLMLIRKLMKIDANLSYKRCKSRPTSINLSKVKASRILFAAYFVDMLRNDTLIVNVDEATISRSLKIEYSWSIKGKSTEFKNAPFSGSVKVIMAILSNGFWFAMLTQSNIDSEVFIEFLDLINQWIRRNCLFGYSKIIMTLDNCPCHQSKKTKKFMEKLGYKILFLPPYSPQLSPIEGVFGVLKHRLKMKYRFSAINLSSKINHDKVFNALKTFDSSQIRAYFKNFYQWIRTILEAQMPDNDHQ